MTAQKDNNINKNRKQQRYDIVNILNLLFFIVALMESKLKV